MVTLASSSKGNSPATTNSAHQMALSPVLSLKSPMRFDRHQPARCSKRLKTRNNQQQDKDNNNFLPLSSSTPKSSAQAERLLHLPAETKQLHRGFMGLTSRVLDDTSSFEQTLPVQLLACYEDSSFIYSQKSSLSSSTSSTSTSGSANPFAPSTARRSTHSTTDSMISSSSPGSCSFTTSSSFKQQQLPTNTTARMLQLRHSQALNSSDYYSSASPTCPISALDYCHLYSPSGSGSSCSQNVAAKSSPLTAGQKQQQQHQSLELSQLPPSSLDPVYLEDAQVFLNLMTKEQLELERLQQLIKRNEQLGGSEQFPLAGQTRHSLLSWMLKVCEHQMCQDEIFSLATMILDKFLLQQQQPTTEDSATSRSEDDEEFEFECDEDELKQRQLYLFAACSLLLATKMRQTPRLSIQTLIDYSASELPVELNRDEIFGGELLVLAALKWDLAAIVTPNDFLALLLTKCQALMPLDCQPSAASERDNSVATTTATANNDLDDEIENKSDTNTTTTSGKWQQQQNQQQQQHQKHSKGSKTKCDGSRVRQHTQTLLELCLMDSQLSRFPASILAMSSMAVAIDGLSRTEKTCWQLNDIVSNIHQATHKVNELRLMIDVAFQIEKYVQKLLNSTNDD